MSNINIGLDINTGSTERKLRAISKHTQALADDLQEIDDSTCSECGREMDEIRAYADKELVETGYSCPHCDEEVEPMKLYTVYNGFMGNGPIHVLVVAGSERRAHELASESFKEDSMGSGGNHTYVESYWTELEVILRFDPDQDDTEYVSEVFD